eukprot:TCALIF_09039-PA protein Name:"Similar to ECE1 Endothelin-converting enzyme 1 (Bos taurus)" AED:0.18 eAED:0.18 QI:17/0/0/0.68/0.73/0.75/16/0/656
MDMKIGSKGKQAEETCTTEACVVAAADIIKSLDETADPCEDFFQFSCGGWVASNVIPDSKSKWGKFYELREAVDQAVRTIVETPIEAEDAQAVKNMKNLYNGCLNVDAIEAQGYNKFVDMVYGDEFGGWPMIQTSWDGSVFSTEKVAGDNLRTWLSSTLISVYAYLDSFDTSRNVLYIDQTSLALPRDFYIDQDTYADYISAYKNYIVDIARVMTREIGSGVSDTALIQAADNIVAFETKLAIGVVPDSERRNATEMYNPMTYTELKNKYPIFWNDYFGRVFTDTDVVLEESETVTKEQSSNSNENLLGSNFRWSTCVSKASREDQGFAYAIGSEYIRLKFDDQTRADADALVTDLRGAFKELVTESVWMDTDTQVLAQDKADQIIQLVGYPDWIIDDEELDQRYETYPETSDSNHFDNIKGTMYAYQTLSLNTLRKTPDRSERRAPLAFPAGILQAPFFGKGYPRYLNYGAIGVVMGHEITHGFDDQGKVECPYTYSRQYDGSGSIKQWWSDETINAFADQVQCYIDQYDNYYLEELGEDVHVNGKATQGENVADNGGLHEAFRAYQNSVESQGAEGPLPGLESFSSEQMFFIAYAQVWCEKQTDGGLLNQVLTDPHSPGKYRVWGPVSNSPDFVTAFNCPANSNMNRPNKCVLW